MKAKHCFMFALLGWGIALLIPPQALLGAFTGGGTRTL